MRLKVITGLLLTLFLAGMLTLTEYATPSVGPGDVTNDLKVYYHAYY